MIIIEVGGKMPKRITLRPLKTEERAVLEQLNCSQTAPRRLVERAKMILLTHEGQRVVDIASKLDRTAATVYARIKRFNAEGLSGLDDKPRVGRLPTYTEEERGQMIAVARTHPQKLGLPYGHWSLNRLVEYIHAEYHIGISRAQLARVLEAEGLRWYQEKTYFTERPDPQFVEKRGP
jgi:transposase